MSQKAVEIILTRQLASYLITPIFLVDPAGRLLFYNEPAEALMGRRYDETGEMPVEEWATMFAPRNDDGTALSTRELPLYIALRKHQPAHRAFCIRGTDGASRKIAVTALPLEGQGGRHLGAVAIVWEHEPS